VSDDAAWAAVSHLAAGILLYGGIGWLLGLWLGNQSAFVAGGVVFGVALAMFMLFRRLGPSPAEPETLRQDRS
jgi:F0F1-type ATP synthase assembly protein I